MKVAYKVVLILLVSPLFSYSQILQEGCETAAFGVDADCYANELQFGNDSLLISNSDDWFLNTSANPGSGVGIIDTTANSVIKAALMAGNNISFPRGMAFPPNTVNGNIRYMDATYYRDFYGGNGATDYSTYVTASKNGDNPVIWEPGSNNVTPKTDLIDCYGHMRREGLTASSPLWLFLGFSRVSNSGASYFDAELYAQGISYDAINGFSSAGPDEGHKSWKFDALGNITEIGDLVVSTVFSTNLPPVIELRIWVSREDFNNLTPNNFSFGGQLDGSNNASLYGYADIIPLNPDVGCGVSNAASTAAAPWGTLNSGGDYSLEYENYQFAEFGINLTAFGIDPAYLTDMDACEMPFASILYKSRASASFTAQLKDFNGPIDFSDIPIVPVVAVTDTLVCEEPIGVLSILDTLDGAYYEWQTPDGNIISSPYGSVIQVDQPGTYIAFGAPMQGCSQMESDTIYVPSYLVEINPSIQSDTVWDCSLITDLLALPDSFSYSWMGPNGFISNLQEINAAESGIYVLEVYDTISGCSEFDSILVVDYPCEHLDSVTISSGINTTIMLDTILPTFTVPTDITLNCHEDPNDLNLTGDVFDEEDDCSLLNGEAIYTDSIIVICEGELLIIRTWTLTDECGNEASGIQNITLEDTIAPTFTTPSDITLECGQDINDIDITGDITDESDNCDNYIGQATFQDSIGAIDLCGGYIVYRTWLLVDACGNDTSAVQEITLEDTTSPTFTAPLDITIECDQDPDDLNITGWVFDENDNCDAALGQVTYTDEVFTGDLCSGNSYINRTWMLADACGNDTSIVQIITFSDTTPPSFSNIPNNPTIECDSIIPVPEVGVDIFVNDNCDDNLDIEYTETITPGSCANTYLLVRTWIATDDCGNQDSISQVINYEDTNNPVIITFPGDITIECSDSIPSADLEVIDNCDSDIELMIDDVIIPGPCVNSYSIQRTYTWLDDCGNQNSFMQTITIEDTTPPIFTVPEDVTIECDQDPNDLSITGDVVDESDNCNNPVGEATYADTINTNLPCNGAAIIIRTWTLSDACGNSTSYVQIITLEDTTAPSFTIPADITVDCDSNPDDLAVTGDVTDESDNCNSFLGDAQYSDSVSDDDPCVGSMVITRVWTLTDACGNDSIGTQIITLLDTIAPTLSNVPPDTTVNCNSIPDYPNVSANDICDSDVNVEFSEEIIEGVCIDVYTILRTWTATDECGNTVSMDQVITVQNCGGETTVELSPNTAVCENEIVTFTASYTGEYDTPYFQWQYSSDGSSWEDISGAINSTLTVEATIGNVGWYQVIVANNSSDIGNTFCSVLSNQVLLNVLLTPPPTNLEVSICEGSSYIIGNTAYFVEGNYTQILTASNGCDSIVNLQLEVLPGSIAFINESICEGDSLIIGNSVYTLSGTYIDTLLNTYGCDSIITTELIVTDQLTSVYDAEICYGDSILFNNIIYFESGTYYDTLIAEAGCDSIVVFDLQVLEELDTTIFAEICETETIQIGSFTYDQTGVYTMIFTAFNGCDSTVVLDLTVHPNTDTLLIINGCEGITYSMGGQNYNESGVYTTVLNTSEGCDSIVTLELNLLTEIVTDLEATICDDEFYVLNNISYNTPGIHTQTLIAQGGCDSIVNLTLILNESFEAYYEEIICEGDSVLIFSQYQSNPGEYTEMYTALNGCDSIVTIALLVEPEIELYVDDEEICEGDAVQLFVEGATDVRWTPTTGLSCSDCPDPIASPSSTTTYTVSAESCLGTMVYTQVTVEVNYPPDLEVYGIISLLKGDSALLEAFVNDLNTEITWTNSYGDTICTNCTEVMVQPDYTTTYIVTAISSEGCVDQDEVKIDIRDECTEGEILIPNFITPNGDGANDRFVIKYSGVQGVGLLRIYNRWGELVFQTENVDREQWNGKFLDRDLNPGVYVYYLEVYCLNDDLFIRKGNVTIIK